MKKIILFTLLLITGCSTGYKHAQLSLDAAEAHNTDVRMAFFTKAWGLNRALITESRAKWLALAANKILKSRQQDGQVNGEAVAEVLTTLDNEIGADEAVTTENFAYLTYLLVAGERTDQYLANVDFYLESRKPIWMVLFKDARETVSDGADEATKWKALIGEINSILNVKK